MRKEATEIVVGVVLLSPGRGRERAQPTRGSATYSHFTEPRVAAKNGPDARSNAERTFFPPLNLAWSSKTRPREGALQKHVHGW